MRDRIVIIGIAVAAIVIGVLIFAYTTKTVSKEQSTVVSVSTSTVSTTTVPVMTLAQGRQSAITRRVNYSITSADELAKLWKTIGATSTPPVVDFASEMVLAVFAGKEPGAAITVTKVEDANERLVSIIINRPDSTCTSKSLKASPYEIVTVPATALPLAHEDIVATTSCSN